MKRDNDVNFGFEFNYRNHRIGKSSPLNESQMDGIGDAGSNSSGMFVRCDMCGTYMNYQEGSAGGLDGRWICPSCGTKVREMTAYNQLGRENDLQAMRWDYEEMPPGCAACGGPWPDCKTSCKLYDD